MKMSAPIACPCVAIDSVFPRIYSTDPMPLATRRYYIATWKCSSDEIRLARIVLPLLVRDRVASFERIAQPGEQADIAGDARTTFVCVNLICGGDMLYALLRHMKSRMGCHLPYHTRVAQRSSSRTYQCHAHRRRLLLLVLT